MKTDACKADACARLNELHSNELSLGGTLLRKYAALSSYLTNCREPGICIAYSGGVDSTLLLKAAVEVCGRVGFCVGKPVLAVILETQLHPHSDTETAIRRAQEIGAAYTVIKIDEFQNPEILKNPVNRCYLCKHLLFSRLKETAEERGYGAVLDGTNKDDENEYRPGMRALQELEIKSPLRELGIRKAEIREISAALGLPTASLPSTPCLATRLPYGSLLDRTLLAKIHEGEELMRAMGFYNVRLRYHEPLLRIETDCASFPVLLEKRETVVAEMKRLGFCYVTLDLEGFRSGSMDVPLK